jgi:metallo-beta-lactamase family protein
LIDCGLFQGGREMDEENGEPLGFDPAAIDYLLLTHAHLDHCGRVPLLAKQGFKGEVIATAATRELARLVMLDAAHLQEEDAGNRERARRRQGAEETRKPLAVYGRPIELAAGLRATFIDAGHILGSASIVLEIDQSAGTSKLLFSGDLGNAARPSMASKTRCCNSQGNSSAR